MQNGYRVIWTDEALKNLRNILKYFEENWSDKETRDFVRKLDKRIKLISINPRLFPKINFNKNVRKSVLTKHTVIYYLFEKDMVKLLSLFDPRQHPSKLKL